MHKLVKFFVATIALLAATVSWVSPRASAGVARPWTTGRAGAAIPGELFGVAATSVSNAWAVGFSSTGALLLHWNGSSWAKVSAPAGSSLSAVAATSASNAWAVGSSSGGPLILHWNGTKWSKMAVSAPARAGLTGVSATSASNAWAVGSYGAGPPRTLTLHWNGSSWKTVPCPNPRPFPKDSDFLSAVAAVSATDAWAVGAIASATSGPVTGLLLHWNGSAWTQVPTTSVTGAVSILAGVTATSASNAWVAGCACEGGPDGAITGRWNGKTWTKVSTGVNPVYSSLTAISAISASSAWAVGGYCKANCNGTPDFTPLILRWNGTAWKTTANPAGSNSSLVGVATASATSAWAVGSSATGDSLILHWNGSSWKVSS
jgi:hypothetical protein